MSLCVRLLALLLSSAINAFASGAATQAAFQCDGKRMDTTFIPGQMSLQFEGQSYRLPQVRAASGAKYRAGKGRHRVLFWNKGDRARLQIGDNVYPECHRIVANSTVDA